jgi:DNA primase
MGKGKKWVDYKELKRRLSMEEVLKRYGLFDDLKKSGQNLVGCCPIHGGSNPRQFSVNLEKNIYNCFGDCGGGGNILDLVAGLEGVSVREAGLKLKEWLPESEPLKEKKLKSKEVKRTEQADQAPIDDEPTNPPLTFTLKSLKREHPFFEERAISMETILIFGLGYCTKGMMKGRIVIPIHNELGDLVAYCGRAVSEDQAEEEGKYKLPPKFTKKAVVYNLHRAKKDQGPVVVVESFLSVFRLFQAGYLNVVALMGSSMSQEQEDLLVRHTGQKSQLILLFDNDESGQNCTEDCLARLSRNLFVKAPDYSALAQKPHQLTSEQITTIF